MAKKPVKGFRSSLVASTLALLMLMAVLLIGNSIQKAREGEGKYAFDEELCFDLTTVKDFDNSYDEKIGSGALLYSYYDLGVTQEGHHTDFSILNVPLNGTSGSYGISATIPNVGSDPEPNPTKSTNIVVALNFTKKFILDNDITRMDIYLDCQGADPLGFYITNEGESPVFLGSQGIINIGNLTQYKVTVQDLLKINTLDANKNLLFGFNTAPGDFIPENEFVVFDLQLYCVKEITIPTLTKLGLWMGAGGIFYIFLGLVVSPEYTIEGIIDRIVRMSQGVRKK